MKLIFMSLLLSFLFCTNSQAQALQNTKSSTQLIETNAVIMENAPPWLKRTRVEKVTNQIQRKLEWTVRKIKVNWYHSNSDFENAHGLGPRPRAITVKSKSTQTILLGPQVTNEIFDISFGHELVHVIVAQKYKHALPDWFEEGLANHFSQNKKVDYHWLAQHPFPEDIRSIGQPFKGDPKRISYNYKASQALAEMLEKQCDLENLIRLSVGKKMDDYIKTYCEISDLNAAFKAWVLKKSKKKSLSNQ